jgi:predicted porin
MNKKLITLAVAAAMVAPAAAMADATLYGKLHQSIDYLSQDDYEVLVFDEDTERFVPVSIDGFSGWAINRTDGRIIPGNGPVGPSNRIGVKGSEDLGNGLKAIYQVELGVTLSDRDYFPTNGDRGNGLNMRNAFVGLAGGWGTFLVGRHDTPLKISTGKLDLFADTMADYNGPLGFVDLRVDNAVAYISPSFSGFQFMGAMHAGGAGSIEGQYNIDNDSLASAYSLAAIYSNGPWYASVAYESLSTDLSREASIFEDEDRLLDPFSDNNKWRFGLGMLDWNGFTLTGIYETRENVAFFNDADSNSWEVQAGYSFGNNMVKAAYGSLDRDSDDDEDLLDDIRDFSFDADLNQWTIAFDHNFSKRTKVYALYNNVDDDLLPGWDGFSLGVVHSF